MRAASLALAIVLASVAASSAASASSALAPGIGVVLCLPKPCSGGGSPPPPPATACSDGADNDGDGLVDGGDPGCSGSADTDECNLRKYRAISSVQTHGAYGTFVQAHDWVYADGTACPGAIVHYDATRLCNVGYSGSWDYAGCNATDPPGGVGVSGTFTCATSCPGAASPHTLTARVTPYETWDGIGASCEHSWTSSIPSSDVETVCFVYLGD
jgi:hypothetical protein